MQTAVVDSRLLGTLGAFYNQTCTIQEYSESRSAAGQLIKTWADKTSHTNINCRIAPKVAGAEIKMPNQTYSMSQLTITLAGDYPLIEAQMRAVVAGVNYDILGTRVDGYNVSTVLDVQIVPGSVVS